MSNPRFLQIHTLSNYSAVLLNRDDSGLAKRLPYGGTLRTRISSQCLKRHWRIAENDPHALSRIDGAEAAFRSRELVTRKVMGPIKDKYGEDIWQALEPEVQKAVYGDKGDSKDSRQTLLLGEPELKWLASEAEKLAAAGDTKAVAEAAKAWRADFQANFKAFREGATIPQGLVTALFGRMVTSDPEANITAPVHVAHAFTTHAEAAESDYFTAVDDLAGPGDQGADTIQETELTSGIFYGYVVVDLPQLVCNLGGDQQMAGQVLHNLTCLVAEVSPGAKRGSTAPYSRADVMLLEAGDRQPRSMAEAFLKATKPNMQDAAEALADRLAALDKAYDTGEERRVLSLVGVDFAAASPGSLKDLAEWAQTLPGRLQ